MKFLRSWNPYVLLLAALALAPWTSLCLPGVSIPESPANRLEENVETFCAPISESVSSARDFAAKTRPSLETCPAGHYPLSKRDVSDDYSCSATKPCSNGACCAKSGYCGYGPASCGNGQSPNDVCWSNCDAHAECGQYAASPGKHCPLNVCCSQFGFCGMTSDFCAKTNNPNTTCQSNCDQPGSGASGGDVQSRIIGYYEAWNYQKNCIGMRIQDIPVGSITHLHFAFGYIDPATFEVVPMDGLPSDLFSQLTALKSRNPSLKTIVSLGGWTFNDNGTTTQPVFSNIVSSASSRSKFINNLQSFLQNFGFDGVDFDWEYPGAGDRGGTDEDGVNYTQFLKELRGAKPSGGGQYIVSFTAPTSYWYLQHFDLKETASYVDWINVMSYDLHGVWDANDPIGNQILAHTNLTEIKLALDLYWRNGIDPNKLNLGLGFYGRSFQLSNPSCSDPGCLFKGGAAAGVCTDNSGTLSYREIMQIIATYGLQPYYDRVDAVKYVTWNSDQWVSFDDRDTFQQKIKFANNLGLGGLLIWSLDQDTAQLDALQGVIYPKTLGSLGSQADGANNWENANGGDCRVTDCGVTGCNPGEIQITTQQCDSKRHKSSLCCPLSAAPDPKTCSWQGVGHLCNGECLPGQVALESSKWGDDPGENCWDGLKFYCCDAVNASPNCRWTDCGKTCNSQENNLTWGDQSCWEGRQEFCCSKDEAWTNCAWHGKPGSCFDDHCDTGHQVSLTTSYEGEGKNCGIHLERTRSFCCDPPKGKSPFLPVPLEDLFPHPPTGDNVDTEFNLKVDPTFGGSVSASFSDDPEDGEFGFVVLASPEEIQISLDKRDGSHWELFNCSNAVSEEEQTIRMMCTDLSESSNCDKIYLGHGAPGTIVEMPKGCGPGKYAVVKSLEVLLDQALPHHLLKRGLSASTIYDLTFDYDFRRVPRDLGDTQMRIDYSNELGYWDKVVDKAAKKRKRSLEGFEGSHKRWLEDAWREDVHGGLITREELHARWFGSDIVDWLKGILNGVTDAPLVSNTYSDDFTLILLDEKVGPCPMGPQGTLVSGNLNVQAQTHVEIDTNFGFTLITTLSFPPDLSNSYLYFRNKGKVTAKFTAQAAATATFDSGDIKLLSADQFGAAFAVPGILTIGPNFQLFGNVQGQVTLGAYFESNVNLAQWDVRQTYPDADHDWDPEASKDPDRDGTQELLSPEWQYGISAAGFITAHVKPTVTFGIDFNKNFIPVDSCTVSLVADGYITFHASASTGSSGSSFCYGIDAGADLYASVQAPSLFGWSLGRPHYQIAQSPPIIIVPQTCPISTRDVKDDEYWHIPAGLNDTDVIYSAIHHDHSRRDLQPTRHEKRGAVYGPIIRVKQLTCPGKTDTSGEGPEPCPLCSDPNLPAGSISKRDNEVCVLVNGDPTESSCGAIVQRRDDFMALFTGNTTTYEEDSKTRSQLVKRTSKILSWQTSSTSPGAADFGPYPSCGVAADSSSVTKWYGFDELGTSTPVCPTQITKFNKNQVDTSKYQTDHIYEAQIVLYFLDFLRGGQSYSKLPNMPNGYQPANDQWVSGVLMGYFFPNVNAFGVENAQNLFQAISRDLGGNGGGLGRLALVYDGINGQKGQIFQLNTPALLNSGLRATKIAHRNTAGVFQYMQQNNIWSRFQLTSQLIEETLNAFDTTYAWNDPNQITRPTRAPGQPRAGLRDLYCYFIDRYLRTVETDGGAWATATRNTFANDPMSQGPEGQNWLNTAMSGTGIVTPGAMVFPHQGPQTPGPGNIVQTSYYGAWNQGPAGPF